MGRSMTAALVRLMALLAFVLMPLGMSTAPAAAVQPAAVTMPAARSRASAAAACGTGCTRAGSPL